MPATLPTDEGWSHWPAPAKLNLFLHITGRRADGYHLLQTVFQLLDWGDDIALRVRNDGRIERPTGAHGVAPEDDLTVRAARALQATTRTSLGVDIAIEKRIPQGGGFGGGSSDAATVLLALNRLWRTQLPLNELARIGLALGADVPVFVHGRSAWAEGVGEILVPMTLPERWFLLVDIGISVPTAELFRAPELTRNTPSATIADFVSGSLCDNAFMPVLRSRASGVGDALDQLAAFGAAQITGTGGGMFVPFDDPAAAQAARECLPKHWRTLIARGVDESQAHARLRELP
ncbi:MAG: 4-(cytidine 5'-diphospho)-2-C-methyl-D-erythritol kinase [Lysobacteraceae bacterium]